MAASTSELLHRPRPRLTYGALLVGALACIVAGAIAVSLWFATEDAQSESPALGEPLPSGIMPGQLTLNDLLPGTIPLETIEDAETQYELGRNHHYGFDVAKDVPEAIKWYTRAAKQDHREAQFQLGYIYDTGDGVPIDSVEAIKWYTLAAEQGDAAAQFNLGIIYDAGDGVPRDTVEAIKWYTRAAEQADSGAQSRLGFLYVMGDGVPKDPAKAVSWLTLAAEQGHAVAQAALGYIYHDGDGVPKDMAEALKWYTRSAEQGFAEAQFQLGRINYGVPKRTAEAVELLTRTADLGVEWAQAELARMEMPSDESPRDTAEAIKWLTRAAAQDHAVAQTVVGYIYQTGDGVPKDTAKALSWYTRAAEQGFDGAQFELAGMYWRGEGVPQDFIRAYFWANLAAAGGDDDARKRRDALAQLMTPAQIAEAQRLSSAFKPRKEEHKDEQPLFAAQVRADVTGSGFFITADGYFITNHHVVEDARHIRIQTAGGAHTARVVRQDPANDLALLKVDGTFAALHVRGSTGVRAADRVFTVGYPNPRLQGLAPKFSSGEVAALTGPGDDPWFFQISVPVQPGNSGGPLVDGQGRVVGVVIGQLDKATALRVTGHLPENVNYAVKGTLLLTLLESVPGAELASPPRRAEAGGDLAAIAKSVESATGLVLVDR